MQIFGPDRTINPYTNEVTKEGESLEREQQAATCCVVVHCNCSPYICWNESKRCAAAGAVLAVAYAAAAGALALAQHLAVHGMQSTCSIVPL